MPQANREADKVLEKWVNSDYQVELIERDLGYVNPAYTVRTTYKQNWLSSRNHLTYREAVQQLNEKITSLGLNPYVDHQATIEALQEEVKGLRGALEDAHNQIKLLQDRIYVQGGTQ
jgi:hypothetical protein